MSDGLLWRIDFVKIAIVARCASCFQLFVGGFRIFAANTLQNRRRYIPISIWMKKTSKYCVGFVSHWNGCFSFYLTIFVVAKFDITILLLVLFHITELCGVVFSAIWPCGNNICAIDPSVCLESWSIFKCTSLEACVNRGYIKIFNILLSIDKALEHQLNIVTN